jgi:hypothetical protein
VVAQRSCLSATASTTCVAGTRQACVAGGEGARHVSLRKKMVAEAAAVRCNSHRGTVEVQLRVEARWHRADAFKAAATRSARWCVGRRTSSGQSYMGYRPEARCSTMRL